MIRDGYPIPALNAKAHGIGTAKSVPFDKLNTSQTKYIPERMTILGSTTDIIQRLKWRLEIFKQSTIKTVLKG